jgi:hypothetical protein
VAFSGLTVNPVHSILIGKNGALDPLDEGFKLFRPDKGQYRHTLHNLEGRGVDRWRLISDDQNYYYRPLSEAEKTFALSRDWRVICVCAVESGAVWAVVDFGSRAGIPRYDINLLQEGDKYFVALTRQVSPELLWDEKIEFQGAGDVDHPHTFELRYNHLSQTASLWIDGQVAADGYRGHNQFKENTGLNFGAGLYGSAKSGIGVFRTVRFEAN